jgi:hypothetical protein
MDPTPVKIFELGQEVLLASKKFGRWRAPFRMSAMISSARRRDSEEKDRKTIKLQLKQ